MLAVLRSRRDPSRSPASREKDARDRWRLDAANVGQEDTLRVFAAVVATTGTGLPQAQARRRLLYGADQDERSPAAASARRAAFAALRSRFFCSSCRARCSIDTTTAGRSRPNRSR